MRTGPHPLGAHLTHAAQSYALRSVSASDKSGDSVESMIAGVQKYQSYEILPDMQPLDCCWEQGTVRLLHVAEQDAAQDQGQIPLILVPSLINRYHIFDLYPDRSFMRWLCERGHVVYVLDWGNLCEDPAQDSMEAIIVERLLAAVGFLREKHGVDGVHALGYCMGGTLLCAAASIEPSFFEKLVFVATPWDFSASDNALLQEMRLWSPSALSYINGQNYLSCSLIQSLFAKLYPEQMLQKFSRFLEMEAGSQEERLFVAAEDWLNDGVDLPAEIARCCIKDWYAQNLPATGDWMVGSYSINPKCIHNNALVVASQRDRLVSLESSMALVELLPQVDLIDPECGHIGMMCGHCTIESVWSPINTWLAK